MSKLKSSTNTNLGVANGSVASSSSGASFGKPLNVNSKQQVAAESGASGIQTKVGSFQLANAKQTLMTRNQAKHLESLKDIVSLQQQKKKRTALENISNAGSGSSSTAGAIPEKEETAKRSKYSGIVNTISNNITSKKASSAVATATTAAATMTSAVVAAASSNQVVASSSNAKKVNTKENLSNLIPASFGANILPAAFNPGISKKSSVTYGKSSHLAQAKNGATTANAATVINHKSLSAGLVMNKKGLKDKPLKKLESQTNEGYTCTESNIERQLATTSLSASGESMMNDHLSNKFNLKGEEECDVDEEEAVYNIWNDVNKVTGWEDIDAGDTDEFSANDYVSFIFKYYRERENIFVIDDYIQRQPNLNRQMRLLLVDWMVEVQQQLEFSHEVLYLSVKLLDLYLNSRKVEKEKLQLLGGAAMFIACKFEERMPPIIDDFIYVSDNAYDRKELIKMEIDILKTIKFDIGIPLSYTFLRRYSKCIKADMKFLTLARYILELSLQDYSFAYVRDSVKACAALYLAIKMAVSHEQHLKEAGINEPSTVSTENLTATEWNATLVHYTGSFSRDFIEFLPFLNNLTRTASCSKYKTIFKKYSHAVFFEVAKIPHLSDEAIELLVKNSKKEESF